MVSELRRHASNTSFTLGNTTKKLQPLQSEGKVLCSVLAPSPRCPRNALMSWVRWRTKLVRSKRHRARVMFSALDLDIMHVRSLCSLSVSTPE